MKNKILQEFLNSNLTIIDKSILVEYIDFCISNNQFSHTVFETEYHHILPQAGTLPFKKFSDLYINPWNGTFLSLSNHLEAHLLLNEAINHIGISTPLKFMGKDLSNYSKIRKQSIKNHSDHLTKEIVINGKNTTIAKEAGLKGKHTKNKIFIKDGLETTIYKEAGFKISNTVTKKFIKDGSETTLAKEHNKKIQEIMSKTYIDNYGNLTSINKEKSIKSADTMSKVFTDINGKETTIRKEAIKKYKETYNKSISKRYNVLIDGYIIKENILAKDIRSWHASLEKSTIEKPLGSNKTSKTLFKET